MNRHLSDDELLDRLYGLAENDGHLETCADCAQRFSELHQRRARLAVPEEIPAERLAAQRRKIYARLGDQPGSQFKWIPAVAAGCLLAIGVLLYRPAAPARSESGDAQLFSEVYSMEESTEPRAAVPIHSLFEFEDNQ